MGSGDDSLLICLPSVSGVSDWGTVYTSLWTARGVTWLFHCKQHNPSYHGLEIDSDDAYGDGSLMDEVAQLMEDKKRM